MRNKQGPVESRTEGGFRQKKPPSSQKMKKKAKDLLRFVASIRGRKTGNAGCPKQEQELAAVARRNLLKKKQKGGKPKRLVETREATLEAERQEKRKELSNANKRKADKDRRFRNARLEAEAQAQKLRKRKRSGCA